MSYARRLAALALLGALAGMPFAATPAAALQPAGTQVTFNGGGLGLLLCGSRPEVPKITVGAESKVRLTNGLGLGATLTIDGSTSGSVASGETVEVQFHRGPVSIGMEPDCALNLNRDFEPLTVEVTPATAVPAPARSNPAARPQPRPAGPPPNPSAPGGPGAPAPPESSLFPDIDELALGGGPDDGATLPSQATVVNPDGSPAQRLASDTGPVDKGPIGLLAIIAAVCVVGVSAGAVRAIITQRTTRAEYA